MLEPYTKQFEKLHEAVQENPQGLNDYDEALLFDLHVRITDSLHAEVSPFTER